MKLPDYKTLLSDYPKGVGSEDMLDEAEIIVSQLNSYGITAEVAAINPGPVITQYELKIEAGIKVSHVAGLTNELAMALRAKSIRIEAPIPGKNAIGIEVPKKNPEIVSLKDILNVMPDNPDGINLALGKTIDGRPVYTDLTKAPHMLVAGQTGAGKSVGINSFIISMLVSKTPDDLKMLLIDPKVVELKPFSSIPHLLTPVVTEPKHATSALKWTVNEMERRYKLLAEGNARNIQNYNNNFEKLPFIVVIIDEMADLMMTSGKETEEMIVRIAQKARAVGIHLILTTQRPSREVITGLIKANIPDRIGFKTASNVDARTIMDASGCENLLGNGDMLFKSSRSPLIERIHGSYISYEDVDKIVNAVGGNDFVELQEPEEPADNVRDPKLQEALELIVKYDNPSSSLIQRKLGVHYKRSTRIINQLVELGVLEKIGKGNSYELRLIKK